MSSWRNALARFAHVAREEISLSAGAAYGFGMATFTASLCRAKWFVMPVTTQNKLRKK